MRFCGTCGTPLEPPTETEKSETLETILESDKPVLDKPAGTAADCRLKKFIIPVAAAVLALIVIIIAVSIFIPGKYVAAKGSFYSCNTDDGTVVILNGKEPVIIDGTIFNQSSSLDRKKTALLVDESDGKGSADGYALYLVSDKFERITDGVFDMVLSLSGNGIAFTREQDNKSNTAELCLYSNGKTTTVTSDFRNGSTLVVSPDGKTVAYTTFTDNKDSVGYYWDGKPHELGKDIMPLFIANGGKYIYYNKNDVLYVQKGDNGDSKIKLGGNITDAFFNDDLSQIIFNIIGSNAYISRNANAKEQLSGNVSSFLMPSGVLPGYYQGVGIYPVSNFADTYYLNTLDSVIHIDGKFAADNIVKSISYAYVSDNGKIITYLKNSNVYSVNGGSGTPVELVSGEVRSFIPVSNGGAIFYRNSDDELYYQKGKGKPTLVSNDFQVISDGLFKNKLFYISDGELYVSSGSRGVSIKGIEGDVQSVSVGSLGVSVTARDGAQTNYYYSVDGSKFTLAGSKG